jgi:hypothetical protein
MQKKNTKREKIQRLVLHRETIRLLTSDELFQAAGGLLPADTQGLCNTRDTKNGDCTCNSCSGGC